MPSPISLLHSFPFLYSADIKAGFHFGWRTVPCVGLTMPLYLFFFHIYFKVSL